MNHPQRTSTGAGHACCALGGQLLAGRQACVHLALHDPADSPLRYGRGLIPTLSNRLGCAGWGQMLLLKFV